MFQLDRLAEAGEEAVLLTASSGEQCTGVLASSNGLRFINTQDISPLKDRFLTYLISGGLYGLKMLGLYLYTLIIGHK